MDEEPKKLLDVSVVVPFGDDEDVVGTVCKRLAAYFQEQKLEFELLAIEEDSGDNSHTILAMLRGRIAELEVLNSPKPRQGFATGSLRASGRTVLLIDVHRALQPLLELATAVRRVLDDEIDMVFAKDQFLVCRRTKSLGALARVRGRVLSTVPDRLPPSVRVEVLDEKTRRT